jgi:hypothetical protein
MQASIPYFLDQIRVHVSWIERQLDDGRSFVLGERMGAADFTAYQHIWWLRHTYAHAARFLAPFCRTLAWMERIGSVSSRKGNGISAREALAVGIAARPMTTRREDANDPSGRKVGESVSITPDDYLKVPVSGEIVSLSVDRVVIQRTDPIAGEVNVHFPRAGFIVTPSQHVCPP